MLATNRIKLLAVFLGLLFAGLFFTAPAHAGTMKAYICSKINSDASYSRSYTDQASASTNLAANSGWMFDFTVNGAISGTNDVQASTLAGTYVYNNVINPLSSTGIDIVDEDRALVSNNCNGASYNTTSGTFDYLTEYNGAGVRTAPQGSCSDAKFTPCNDWSHSYGVLDTHNMDRIARAVGNSYITGVNDLWGVSISSGEGWMTYLKDDTGSSNLDDYLKCAPGSIVDGSTTMNPSSFQHDDYGDATPNTNAYYQCEQHLIAPTSASDTTSSLLLFICDNRVFEGGTVKCEKSSSNQDSAWSSRTKSLARNITLPNSKWFGAVAECNSNWSETLGGGLAPGRGTCYTGSIHNRYCNEHVAGSDSTSLEQKARTAHGLNYCSWNAGIWMGGDSPTPGNSTGYLKVADNTKPTVSPPELNTAQSCDGWYSLPCFQAKASSTATSFDVEVTVPATHELGIDRTFLGINHTPDTAIASDQLTTNTKTSSGAATPEWSTSCRGDLAGDGLATQSCYQPCARHISGGSSSTNYSTSTALGFGAMVPCLGSSSNSANNDTVLAAKHSLPMFKNGIAGSPFKTGTNTLQAAASDPTVNITSQATSTQIKIDDVAPGLGPAALASCNTSAASGPAATANTGVNSGYWNLSSTNLIALKGYACDAQSGIKASRMYYQTCLSSCDNEASWKPSLDSVEITAVAGASPVSGKATYTTAKSHNFDVGDHIKISGIYVSGSAANTYNSSDATITAVTSTTFTAASTATGAATLNAAKADPVGADFAGTVTGNVSQRQITGSSSALGFSQSGNGCANLLSTPTINTSAALPASGSTCSFSTTGLASGSQVRFKMAAQDSAYNVALSNIGSVVTMDGAAPLVQTGTTGCQTASSAPVKVTGSDGVSTKTGTVDGYWGSSSQNFMFLSSSSCDAISGINKAEIHYQTCPSSSACTNSSDWSPSITTANAGSIMGTQAAGTDAARLSDTGCARTITSTVANQNVAVPDASSSASTCKFKATNLNNGDRVRFVNVALDGAGIYAVSDPSSAYIIDNDTPASVDPAAPTCGTSGYPLATNSSGDNKTGSLTGYWSPILQASMNLNAAACDSFSGVGKMEIHYQTCAPTTSDSCGSSSAQWTPAIKTSSWDTQMGSSSGTTTNRLDSSCTRTISSPASNSVATLPTTKSLTSSSCKFLTTGLADNSKVRFVLLSQDGAGNSAVSSPGSAITMDSTDPKTVATTASSCATAVDPGVAVSKSGGAIKTGTADGYWSPVVASQMLLQSAGCDAHSGVVKAEMHYQTCATGADCSNSSNWTPSINSVTSSQASSSADNQSNRLSGITDCMISVSSPTGGSRVNVPATSSSGCKFLTTGLADGSKVRFVLFNTDAAGNTNASAPSSTYTIDGSPPGSSSLSAKKYNPNGATDAEQWAELTAESGSVKTWTNTTKVRVIWDNSSDLSGVVSAKTSYAPGSCSVVTEDPVTGTSKDFDQDRGQECRQGQHTFSMWAKDGAGNQTADASPATLKFHYDSDPTVESNAAYAAWSVLSPLQPQKLRPQSFTAVNGSGSCTPGATSSSTYNSSNSFTICWINPSIDAAALGSTISPIKAVHFRVGGDEVQTVTKTACLLPGGTCSISTSEAPGLSASSNGSHPVTVWLEDQAGNSDLKQSVAGTLKLFLTTICP